MYFFARVTPPSQTPVEQVPADAPLDVVMPPPDYLEIAPNPPGVDVIMSGYTDDGRSSGDTWHATLAEAKDEAWTHYGVPISAWTPIERLLHPGAPTNE